MPDPASPHDVRVLDDLLGAVEASMQALQADGLSPKVRDQALARRAAVDELRAAGARREAGAAGDGLLEKAQRALERFSADTGDAPPADVNTANLDGLERGEDALQQRFAAVLDDDRLSGPARDAVLRAYDHVKPGHDAIRQAALAARGEA